MNSKIFQAEDFYMLRVPILPFEAYQNLFGNEQGIYEDNVVTFLKENPEVIEAITVASSSLGAELVNLDRLRDETRDPKKRAQVFSALTKYLIRMSTRTTPYGLFSGVTLGRFSDRTDIALEQKYSKRSRPDMEWIYKVIREIENDENLMWHLKVRANPLGIENGNRLDMCYISNYGQISNHDNSYNTIASIRHTKQVAFVMDHSKDFVSLNQLRETIWANNPKVAKERIDGFLKELLKNEYLLTELRPPLINDNPFQYILKILNHLESADQYYQALKEVADKIQAYDATNIGDGIALYEELISKMKAIHEVSNYLQVDLAVSGSNIEMNNNVKAVINDMIDILSRLSSVYSKSHLDEYLKDFIELYGEDREVPLLELLDEDKGLGAPATYTKPLSRRQYAYSGKTSEEEIVEKYFKLKVSEALKQGKNEIVIKEEEVEALKLKDVNLSDCIESLEVYALVQRQNEDNYQVFLGPNHGSPAAGKTFGRFMDIMPKETKQHFENLYEAEGDLLGKETVIAEIVELPQNGRSSNVTLNWSPKAYEINMATTGCQEKNQILIQDLYIGVTQVNGKHRFYIKSPSLNKEVHVKANNMANYMIFSNIYRFLCEVSEYGKAYPFQIMNKLEGEYFKNFGYIPKIKFRNIVLQPECWYLTEMAIGVKKDKLDKKVFLEALDQWRESWGVSKNVYLTEYDNRLMLDLTHPVHREELYQSFTKSSKSLLLTGIDNELDGLIAKNDKGAYISEIVVPMRRVQKDKKVKPDVEQTAFQSDVLVTYSPYKKNQSILKTWDDKRTFVFGDEWMYFKLYGLEKRIDEFIGYELSEFCENVKLKNISTEFFFIRYADPAPHVRLRFKVKKEKQSEMIQTINEWFKVLTENGLLSKVQTDTYIRETERYGGEALIELAENIFHYDSIFASLILKMKRMGRGQESFDYFVCASVIDLLEGIGISFRAQNELFSKLIDQKLYREAFKKDRKMYMNVCNSHHDWENLRKEPFGEDWYALFKERRECLEIFSEKMMHLDHEGKLTNSKVGIILSLVHMHFNRIYGSVSKERKLMSMIRHTLQSLEYSKAQEDEQIVEKTS